ncbi:MAG: hypothetical protein QOG68_1979 [Solirubrobacteraceae bacterium]|jgi:hypothetical protein|nr:hypothetical protein [Solirubrobacteraceae bacterium]
MRRLLIASVPLVVLAGTVSLGEAALPKLKTKTIVVGKSIGGVVLGASFKDAKKAWGKGGKCVNEFGSTNCTYETKKPADGQGQYSGTPGKKVTEIVITAGLNPVGNGPVFNTPLAKLKTSKGIHIGSTAKAVAKAYPKAKFRLIPMSQGYEYYIKGPGKAATEFQMSKQTDGQVQFIQMTTPR